jgi:serine/threonine protein phosphatase PrpC
MKIRAFITHKMCEQYADCQDRFCINEDNRRIGLSDGMSQSIFSDYWAEILSKQYADEGHCDEEDRKKLCALWIQRVMAYLQEQKDKGIDPWRAENSIAARKGAGATVCGVRFENATDWNGDVLGDSCIIKVNTKDWTIEILTSEDKAFDSFPDFYDSYPEKLGRGSMKSFEGRISPDDMLLLVSDPFSEYIAKSKENAKELIEQIQKLSNHEDYCKLVDDWRTKGMHNDDSTLCIVEFDNRIDFDIQYRDIIADLIEKEKISTEKKAVDETSETCGSSEAIYEKVAILPNDDSEDNSFKDIIIEEEIAKITDVGQNGITNDKIIEINSWILSKIDSLLKCSIITTNSKGFFKGKKVVNKVIAMNKVENLRKEIEEYFSQLMK